MSYKGFYITYTEDCEENLGGYFCQVYADKKLDYEIDYFCIHKEELINNNVQENIMNYINEHENELINITKNIIIEEK